MSEAQNVLEQLNVSDMVAQTTATKDAFDAWCDRKHQELEDDDAAHCAVRKPTHPST